MRNTFFRLFTLLPPHHFGSIPFRAIHVDRQSYDFWFNLWGVTLFHSFDLYCRTIIGFFPFYLPDLLISQIKHKPQTLQLAQSMRFYFLRSLTTNCPRTQIDMAIFHSYRMIYIYASVEPTKKSWLMFFWLEPEEIHSHRFDYLFFCSCRI